MHPEADIAAQFWMYVNERGHGNTAERYPSPPALMAELERQYWVEAELKGEEALRNYLVPSREGPESWVYHGQGDDDHYLPPTGFATLQDALYDYLIARVGGLLIANDYELWLRGVAHILADAARDASRLVIPVMKRREDDLRDEGLVDQTMTISDDWSVLRRETFDFARRNYERYG